MVGKETRNNNFCMFIANVFRVRLTQKEEIKYFQEHFQMDNVKYDLKFKFPEVIYSFKIINGNTKTVCEMF